MSITAINDTPVYSGNVIDLSTLKIASLFKGTTRQFLAEKLNARDIDSIVSKEKALWHAILKFKTTGDVVDNVDIWLEFRSNIHAANLYINDSLFFRNGTVDTLSLISDSGKNLVRKRIPKSYLIDGENKLEIEFTNYKSKSNTVIRDLSIGNLEAFQNQTAIMTTAPILLFGIFSFLVLINLVMYFSLDRKKVFLLLALLFLVNSILVAYEVLYWNGFVPSASLINSYTIRGGLEYGTYLILLFILIIEFEFGSRTILLAILAYLIVYTITITTSFNVAIALSLLPFLLGLKALWNKVEHSIVISVSLFILLTFNYLDDYNIIENYDFVESNFIITSLVYKLDGLGLIVFALVMIFISAKRILAKTKSLNEANLKLERLEYQFLQKLILPHFIVNSLMSLQELIANKPNTANKMIEALSKEFHLLSTMSKKKLVPIHQEIEMCNAHLKIVSFQQKAKYKMNVIGISGDELVPPTIIHTLVENGITHGYSGNQNAIFDLSKKEVQGTIIYRLFNDSDKTKSDLGHSTGLGLKYIEARLEECYPERWQLRSSKTRNGWESIIEIRSVL
ncbi:hypothetical protein D2V08_03355 [Flagellimonas lutimaris]|uniref:Signal transduction histidine kinase internal region domain-containing protein n=1 Tax=Flagellimonas lutimaris TaxID=475082 RepID=A0A3A1NAT7_9FLAO|nr:histidine kinase [Allomuricauda lutimaris]RIV35996.1 hypothetical protein D2V08_03355 [Allomuricauda lutimaris]